MEQRQFGGRTRKKVIAVDYRQVMSGRKIVRLKTPGKNGQEGKGGEETRLESEEFSQESTLLLVKSVACSEQLQVQLINEINKVYRELSKLRKAADSHEQECKHLKSRAELAQREARTQKELYQLEKDNHRRLRKFYQAREQEWVSIVNEHRRILEQYHQASGPTEDQYSQLESMYTTLEQMLSSREGKPKEQEGRRQRWTRGVQLRSSVDREDSLSPKFQLNLHSQKGPHSRDTSQTRIENPKQTYSSLRPNRQSDKPNEKTPPKQSDEKTPLKPQDGFLQLILRRTYERYRLRGMCVDDIEQLQDMIKLKNAKTSTRQRLAKTIRKLDVPVSNEAEMKNLCECVERSVTERHRTLRGDFVFDFLVQRLRYYQGNAISPSSMHRSMVGTVGKCQTSIGDLKVIELPLDSAIKDQKTLQKILKRNLESTSQPKAKTPQKSSNESREPQRMKQSLIFHSKLQSPEDLKRK